jgi:thioredoxin family protein
VLSRERFAQGLTFPQYLDQMTMNKERFIRALDTTVIKPQDVAVLTRHGEVKRILVITEDWCGTSIAHVPFIARLVDGRPGVELRVFLRDQNPDVMDQFLKRGLYRSIPVIVFFDEDMNELARYIEERAA